MTSDKEEQYDANSIQSLTPRQHLLKRMSLVFGSVESEEEEHSKQKGVALREILDNALDEIRAQHGNNVRLNFYRDRSFEVQDSGRGIPTDKGKDADGNPASGIYLALGVLQSGGKFATDSKRFSSGLNGLGGSAVVNVAKRASVWVYRNNKEYFLEFRDGTPGFFHGDGPDATFTPLSDYTYVKSSQDKRSAEEKKRFKTGTKIRIWLDDSVFSSHHPYNDQDVITRLRGTAFLVPSMHAEVYNELHELENPDTGKLEPQREHFHFPEGISQLVELNQTDDPLHDTVVLQATGEYTEKNVAVLQPDGSVKTQTVHREVPIELAFRYGNGYDYNMHSYVNTIHTKLAGVHETGFERAMHKAFNEKFQSMRGVLTKNEDPPVVEDFKEGLTVVLSVQVAEPNFTSQSKEALSGREVQKAIQETLTRKLDEWVNAKKNADALNTIANKVVTASRNRQKAKEQRDLSRRKNEISTSSLPAKLVDCDTAGTDEAELYICEGDSAVGSMKAARDGQKNALLGIRGKPINSHRSSLKQVLNNMEVQDIIKTIGAGSGDHFDIEKMRYGRIFIAVDADPDGGEIACLLYTLFWHLFRPIVEQNKLYVVQTPLFVFSVKGRKARRLYAQDEKQHDSIVADLEKSNEKYTVSRLKGLGEVPASTLEETAIDPNTRTVLQVSTDDAEQAQETLDALLGNDPKTRKRWLESTDHELIA